MPAELEEIDKPRDSKSSAVPLVLIHDGGGTIFQYYMLGPLNREVYGIANPYHNASEKPAGGIHELAREYVEAIRKTIGRGPVIVGGWSFGGMISLEVSRLLQNDTKIRVIGMLFIDSICPWGRDYQNRGRVRPSFRATTSEQMKEKVIRSFDNAREMISVWDRPAAFPAPPAVMIRATNAMPLANSPDGMQPSQDADGRLGWSEFDSVTFRAVIDVPGNHFSMFEDARLDNVTEKIKEACGLLEKAL